MTDQPPPAIFRKLSNVGSFVQRSLTEGDERALTRKVSRAFYTAAEELQDVGQFLDLAGTVAAAEEGGSPTAQQQQEEAAPPTPTKAETTTEQDQPPAPRVTSKDLSKVIFQDKLAFFIGVLDVVLTAFWCGKDPSTLYHFWCFKCCTLFPMRFFSYKKRGHHYLMFEYCYVANLVGLYHVYFAPASVILRKLTFCVGAGPLMWSIMAMRNSLVFHDADKMTTLMMHASPALVAWTLRWYPSPEFAENIEMQTAGVHDLLVLPVLMYLAWMVAYYLLNFVLLHNRIQKRGYIRMFELMIPTKDPEKAKRSPLARFVLSVPPALQPILYLCVHATAATLSFVPTLLFFNSFVAHTAALGFCLGLSAWNAGGFYFHVFAKKYMARIEEAAIEAAASRKANGGSNGVKSKGA